jgi:peptide deformylase
MAILPINVYGCDILKKKAKPFKDITDNTIKMMVDMVETLKNANGVGLAANQIGIASELVLVDLSAVNQNDDDDDDANDDDNFVIKVPKEFRKPTFFFNPEIIKSWDDIEMEEGCLSVPDIRVEITRPEFIKVKYRDDNFNEKIIEADNYLARVLQHEIDHIHGTLITDKTSRVKTAFMKKKLKKIEAGEYKPKYPIAIK